MIRIYTVEDTISAIEYGKMSVSGAEQFLKLWLRGEEYAQAVAQVRQYFLAKQNKERLTEIAGQGRAEEKRREM